MRQAEDHESNGARERPPPKAGAHTSMALTRTSLTVPPGIANEGNRWAITRAWAEPPNCDRDLYSDMSWSFEKRKSL